jgi:long-chain acyl-CoA synthetase
MNYADKPWLKGYKLGPYKLDHSLKPYPEVPVYKVLDDAAENYPRQTAVLFLGRQITYEQLRQLSDRLANALLRLGLNKGDRVCVFLPNCPEFIISNWAIMKAGGTIVPISTSRTDEGLIHEAGSSEGRIIICREEHLERVLGARGQCHFQQIIVTSTEGYDVQPVAMSLPSGVLEFRKLIDENEAIPAPIDIDSRQDLCELAFTGGATGVPKGVMITHCNRFASIMQGCPWMLRPLSKGIAGKASMFMALPLFHSYGHWACLSAASLGLRIILMPNPRDTNTLVQCIKEYRPLLIPTVPTQLMRIAQAEVGKMNVVPVCGAAPLPKEISEAIKKEIGTPVTEGYGLTETSTVTHLNLSAFSKITGFMPREKLGMGLPVPDTECKLVDPDTGREVPFGESGEVVVRGPQIMKGYWPETGSGLTEEGWLHTGDIAHMDEDGYFHISDRVKDMVNVSGNKVYTTTVDEILYRHPAVHMAAAIGVPDAGNPGSERVMAVIQLKEDSRGSVTAEDIQDFCRQHLAPYAVPKFVEFREEMPMTVTEKLFKKALRDEVIGRLRRSS